MSENDYLWVEIETIARECEPGQDPDDCRSYFCGEPYTFESSSETRGELFANCQTDYGRCISKIYVDQPPAEGEQPQTLEIGWVFSRREAYEDAPEKSYLRETWVTALRSAPVTTTTFDYATADRK